MSKKIVSLILAMLLVLVMAAPAFATTLTIKEPENVKDATYEGYKILNATNNADNHTKYAYTLNEKYTAILQAETGKNEQADIIEYISKLDTEGMRKFANNVYEAIKAADPAITADASLKTGDNTVDQGYWLIAQTSAAGDLETSSLVMIDTTGLDAVEINSKKSTFTVDKKVTDESQLNCKETHTHTAGCYDWSKSNNSPIGATVQYEISTSVPAQMASYKNNAYFIVGDILGQGLDLVKDSITVQIDGETATAGEKKDYTIRFSDSDPACEEGYTFQVALVNPKDVAGKSVTVYYNAVVNKDAELTLTGNPNEADVTYTPKDDVKYDGEPSGDGFPRENDDKPSGTTPKSITVTYVTGIKFVKVDAATKKPLNGAEFTITGTTETTELIWKQEYTEAADGTYYKLNDGSYTTQAPRTADEMKKIDSDTYVGGYVVAGENDTVAVTVGGVDYRVSTEADFRSKDIYELVKANASSYASTTTKYTYSEGWEEQTATKDVNVTVKVDENGIAKLPGLAKGTYHIVESKVPQGYNKIADFDVVIDWTAPTTEELTTKGEKAECTWSVKLGDKVLEKDDEDHLYVLTVENSSGVELPSTGGIGTTIFYIAGGILLVGAAVLLITKKRVGNHD